MATFSNWKRDRGDQSFMHTADVDNRLNLLEDSHVHRGDAHDIFKDLDFNVHSDFHDVIKHLQKGETLDVWASFNERIGDMQKALNIMLGESPNSALKAILKYISYEGKAYKLILKEEHLVEKYTEQEETSVLASLICKDTEFRAVYTLWRWCHDASIEDPKGFSELAEGVQSLSNVRNIRSGVLRSINNTNCGADVDANPTDADKPLEEQLYRVLFSLIRCGKIDNAIELVRHVGMPSLAVPLHMYNFLVDPTLSPLSAKDSKASIPAKRVLFLETMKKMYQTQTGATPYLRMIWSSLGGLLEPLLSMATRTEDRLWCYSNAVTLNKLQEACNGYVIGDVPSSSQTIFEEILATERLPYFVLYDLILRKEWAEVVSWAAQIVRSSPDMDNQLLRFLSNLTSIVIIKQMNHSAEDVHDVLNAYIERLADREMYEFIPTYASFLPYPMSVQLLLKIMSVIRGDEERMKYLKAIDDAGFNRDDLTILSAQKELHDTSAHDLLDNLKWLILNGERTLPSLVEQTNNLFRHFIAGGDLESAYALMNSTSSSDIDLPTMLTNIDVKSVSAKFESEINEYNCHHQYMETHNTCEKLADLAMKLMKYQVQNLQKSILNENDDDWKSMDLVQTTGRALEESQKQKELRKKLASIGIIEERALEMSEQLFRHDGWRFSSPDEPERSKQLTQLRDQCGTDILETLINSLHEIPDSKAIVEIAMLLADSTLDVENMLSRSNLRKILSQIHNYTGHLFS
ncbi:unnamed protein product [Auanema sp. JU1783]|nr:unnamed protein product [Auanema sp. JU1783]